METTSKREPKTAEEWQDAVDAANYLLCLDAARQFGLVTGGPTINAKRCRELLDRGRERGVIPYSDAPEER